MKELKAFLKEIQSPAKLKRLTFYAVVAAGLFLLSAFLTVSLVFLFRCGCYVASNDQPLTSTNSTIITESKILKNPIVSRDQWLAEPASEPLKKLELPVHRVIISHTTREHCNNQAACILRVRDIQNFHMKSLGFSDIGYNFLVGGNGNVYEGRGWDQQGAHTKGFNADSVCISFIGTYDEVKPSDEQLNAAKLIIAEGVRLRKIVDDYRFYGSLQLGRPDSTGKALYEEVQKLPHCSSSLYDLHIKQC